MHGATIRLSAYPQTLLDWRCYSVYNIEAQMFSRVRSCFVITTKITKIPPPPPPPPPAARHSTAPPPPPPPRRRHQRPAPELSVHRLEILTPERRQAYRPPPQGLGLIYLWKGFNISVHKHMNIWKAASSTVLRCEAREVHLIG